MAAAMPYVSFGVSMPPHDCCEFRGVFGPEGVLAASVGAGPGLIRVSKKATSAAMRFSIWLVAPEIPTYDGTTQLAFDAPPRRISVWGRGLEGHNIHGTF